MRKYEINKFKETFAKRLRAEEQPEVTVTSPTPLGAARQQKTLSANGQLGMRAKEACQATSMRPSLNYQEVSS